MFKVASADHRIVKVEDGRVSFTYRKTGSHRPRTLTLDALEFIRRFLQHVLPTGFIKVRYYGFLSPTAKRPLVEVTVRVELAYGFVVKAPERGPAVKPQPVCPICGGPLRFHRSLRLNRHPSGSEGLTVPTTAPRLTASG